MSKAQPSINPYENFNDPQATSATPPLPSPQPPFNPWWLVWPGRVISALPVLGLLMSAYFKFAKPPGMADGLKHIGWTEDQMSRCLRWE